MTLRKFLVNEDGFEGAEKSLLVCVGLALIALLQALIGSGVSSAGTGAEEAMKNNPLGQG